MSVSRHASPPTFALECFDWAGPDRLEVAGTFAAVPAAGAEPVLVVHGDDGPHELLPVGEPAGVPRPGERWQASFAWQEPPDDFTTAELRLGDMCVELPGLRSDGEPLETLAVRRGTAAPAPAAARLHLEAELLAARERTLEAERALERTRAQLERAAADLEAERAGRGEDAERFREGLAAVERAAAEELEQARAHLDAAEMAREQAEQLREQLAGADARADALRERLEAAAREMEQTVVRLRAAAGDSGAP